jgi:hypothetical protein
VRSDDGAFAAAEEHFGGIVSFLRGDEAASLTHGELECRLQADSRELFRLLTQDHLDLRAQREARVDAVADSQGVTRPAVEAGHRRVLATVFGAVQVSRLAYRRKGHGNLHPADAVLNLPTERHSHGLRRLAAIEAARSSFDGAVEAIERASGQVVGKRQAEGLARRAVRDFEAFYEQRPPEEAAHDDVLVLSCDGKGVVMRPEALRAATAKAAAGAGHKLATRLSKGEKRNRKRMAEVGTVYDATPAPRIPADVLPESDAERQRARPGAKAKNKWLTASVTASTAAVVSSVFDEADRRDPAHERTWVALVDGNRHQIDRIRAEARRRKVKVSILVDIVHVLEYLWKAAWSFHAEGDPAAEAWVRRHATSVLAGEAGRVAGSIRRAATRAGLSPTQRTGADQCAGYLTRKARHLDYPTALERGWPIATGVIEGACRHLVKDRMDLTGARWGLDGAETVLKLRALQANGDFDDYWSFHTEMERRRLHESRYANGVIPRAA